jgi:steroid 5-alpha reductase family enzyme
MTFWVLAGYSALLCMIFFASVWLFSYRINNAGFVDVAWAFAFSLVAVLALLLARPPTVPGALLAGMIMLWSVRLGGHLLHRVAGHHPIEDGRYQTLRQAFPKNTWLMFFGFFQAQAILVLILAYPLLLVVTTGPTKLHPLHLLGFVLWLIAWVGESLADRQLAAFRANPANRAKTCRSGLWAWSRHPNYFFEWLVWVAWFLYALPSPLGWLAITGPILMLIFLFRVTGIPATEAQSLRSRGADYRNYQLTTSAFFPWPPKAPKSLKQS